MKSFRLHFILPLLGLLLSSIACQTLFSPSPQGPGAMLFQDDFSDTGSGWSRVTTIQGETDYADGVYRIFVNEPNLDIWSMPGKDFQDVRIEVDALKVGGERDNRFGIICRAVRPDSFYTFIVSSDGYYGIGKIRGQDYTLIEHDALQPSSAILKGAALNHLRADCIGDTLTLYVNGEKLTEVRDAEFPRGDVGLIAGTYQTAGTDIRFDNFIVYAP
ncbi:MAG: hypothetical protein B6D39_01675 [Anaerolineae bacterium UTCFX2]|jgi:hypothetical protein|nr:hypothetical protein [Anaerolineae bacterium]MCZ7552671.1 DUF1080 domain-containing protein [Anaerolineales bacterium]OQY94214.1 MAG: hypothetical protein B6D39_01675 [Anaerolineae bacterium UTCFX2]